MLVIDKSPDTQSGVFISHRFTRIKGLGQCRSMLAIFCDLARMSDGRLNPNRKICAEGLVYTYINIYI